MSFSVPEPLVSILSDSKQIKIDDLTLLRQKTQNDEFFAKHCWCNLKNISILSRQFPQQTVDLAWAIVWSLQKDLDHDIIRDGLIHSFSALFQDASVAREILVPSYPNLLSKAIFLGTKSNVEYQRIMNGAVFSILFKYDILPRQSSATRSFNGVTYTKVYEEDAMAALAASGSDFEACVKEAKAVAALFSWLPASVI